MGKENDLMLDYLRDNRRFADLFNGGLFGGETIINAGDLQEGSENYTEYKRKDTTSKSREKNKKKGHTIPRSRDLKKRLRTGAALRILAIEEQSHIDYTMPWRCMNYDSLEYSRQVQNIQKKNQECPLMQMKTKSSAVSPGRTGLIRSIPSACTMAPNSGTDLRA